MPSFVRNGFGKPEFSEFNNGSINELPGLDSNMDVNQKYSFPVNDKTEKRANGHRDEDRIEKHWWSMGRFQIATVVLAILVVVLLIVVIVISVTKDIQDSEDIPKCSSGQVIDLSEPDDPSIFHDLTKKEVRGLMEYLYRQKALNLTRAPATRVDTSYVFSAELHLPDKNDAILYLNSKTGTKPRRSAKVIIFRGDLRNPYIQEIVVSPLPNPTNYTELHPEKKIPFLYRPITGPDYGTALTKITEETNKIARDVLFESYGGYLTDCKTNCLVFRYISIVSPAVSGESRRKYWFWMSQFVEFYVLHPVDFSVLVDMEFPKYSIEKVWYNGYSFDSLAIFVQEYKDGNILKKHLPFPISDDNLFSKMTRRGKGLPEVNQRPPITIEPDGKRYSVIGQHIKYMNWDFDFRMSTVRGPQLYDIRFKNKRIVYELALPEVAVFYSGYKPSQKFANYVDSSALIGPQDKGMVPGVDCPTHATFIDASHLLEGSDELITFPNAICVFEQNTGMPLRRHHSHSPFHGSFYEGVPNSILILRVILTVVNYDYILDHVFYQNGAMEVKVVSSGYIITTAYTENEKPYGFRVSKNINGNLHHHMFHYKVDLDIEGTNNRYEVLNISVGETPNKFNKSPQAKHFQGQFTKETKISELEAAYNFDFNKPKYHIFCNNLADRKFESPPSYRIQMRSTSKQILPKGEGNEPAISWMRYQMAVTKRKEEEETSSSLYSGLDAKSPVVNFQNYVDDNETIIDEDLVAWISMGTQHIPHSEDLPVTHTPGMDLSFFLLPYNYFPEDPSMASRDSIRIEPIEYNNPKSGVKFTGKYENDLKCFPSKKMYKEQLESDPGILFEASEGGGTVI